VTSSERDPPLSRVVLTCGIAGAGKTTYAKRLEARGYVRLSIDEEVWRRFGRLGVDYSPDRYEEHSAAAEAALERRLLALIAAGRNVVLDYSFWRRDIRERYKRLIHGAGARWELVYLKVDPDELRQRLAQRNTQVDANAPFPITTPILEKYLAAFEEPRGEGERVVRPGAG
jgi:predicted kinase